MRQIFIAIVGICLWSCSVPDRGLPSVTEVETVGAIEISESENEAEADDAPDSGDLVPGAPPAETNVNNTATQVGISVGRCEQHLICAVDNTTVASAPFSQPYYQRVLNNLRAGGQGDATPGCDSVIANIQSSLPPCQF